MSNSFNPTPHSINSHLLLLLTLVNLQFFLCSQRHKCIGSRVNQNSTFRTLGVKTEDDLSDITGWRLQGFGVVHQRTVSPPRIQALVSVKPALGFRSRASSSGFFARSEMGGQTSTTGGDSIISRKCTPTSYENAKFRWL